MKTNSRKRNQSNRQMRELQRYGQCVHTAMIVTDNIDQGVRGSLGKRTYYRRAPNNTERGQWTYLKTHGLLKGGKGAVMQFMHGLWHPQKKKKKKKALFSRGK